MQKTRTNSSGTTAILIAIIVIITFPFWIGILAGLLGLVLGGVGGLIGIIFGAFGAVIGALGGLIGSIFNDGPWHWQFGFWHGNIFAFFAIVLLIAIAIRPRR